jgi:hypothetical protein
VPIAERNDTHIYWKASGSDCWRTPGVCANHSTTCSTRSLLRRTYARFGLHQAAAGALNKSGTRYSYSRPPPLTDTLVR